MKSSNSWARAFALVALASLVTGGAYAQLQTGNLYGTVTDQAAAALPGVTVTLTGQTAPQVQVTNAQGQFRFLGLSPGSYSLKAELEGFSTIDYPNISINVGRNTSIEVKLSAAVEQVITVTAESPLLDTRKITTGATVGKAELEKIPTSRDPWVILQTAPGVQVDRVNVAGNNSGQQSAYVGPGSGQDQAVWAVDGVVITDMAAIGSTPAYFDFDAFEEMQVTTGGTDTTIATGGVVLNMVTKRGTNEWRGSGRYYLAKDSWQSKPSVSGFGRGIPIAHASGPDTPGVPQAPSQSFFNHIKSIKDYGAELGGPIVRDRLWIWGSYGEQDVDLRTANGLVDKTQLPTWNAKVNAQLAATNSATVFAFDNNKKKQGRNAGPTRPQETTWNQDAFGSKPSAYKIEDTQIFSSNFYLTGLYSRVNGGFELVPQGGIAVGTAGPTARYDVATGIWHNTQQLYQTPRPQHQFKGDASAFFNTGTLSHELKFGAGYRDQETTTNSTWPGVGYILGYGPGAQNTIVLNRARLFKNKSKYTSAYAQDTMTAGRLTANVGLRYDRQTGVDEAVNIPGNSIFPNLLPAVSYAGGDHTPTWTNITPRLGITYALGADRTTLLRASYSRFADQLSQGVAGYLNRAAFYSYAYAYTYSQGPHVAPSDVFGFFGYSGGVDPRNGGLLQSNGMSNNLSAPITDEVLGSIEHALLPEFVVGVNVTYRKLHNLVDNKLLVFNGTDPFCAACLDNVGRPATAADYVAQTVNTVLPDGTHKAVTYYLIKPGLSTRSGGYLYNGGDEQEYKGASVTFNKRLANRWMLRGNVTYSDWKWSKVPAADRPNPTASDIGGERVGDPVLQASRLTSGSFAGVYINSKWSYSVNGLYQIAPDRPWGFNAALAVNGREGYPAPYFVRITLPNTCSATTGCYTGTQRQFVRATGRSDSFRLDNINTVDARLEKEFTFSDFGTTVSIDCFNLLNKSTVLQRQLRLNRGNSDYIAETLSPRIFRVGLRLNFR